MSVLDTDQSDSEIKYFESPLSPNIIKRNSEDDDNSCNNEEDSDSELNDPEA